MSRLRIYLPTLRTTGTIVDSQTVLDHRVALGVLIDELYTEPNSPGDIQWPIDLT